MPYQKKKRKIIQSTADFLDAKSKEEIVKLEELNRWNDALYTYQRKMTYTHWTVSKIKGIFNGKKKYK